MWSISSIQSRISLLGHNVFWLLVQIDSFSIFYLWERISVAGSKLSHEIVILELPAKTWTLLSVFALWPDVSAPLALQLCSFIFYFSSIASCLLEEVANSYFFVGFLFIGLPSQIFMKIYYCTCGYCLLRVIPVFCLSYFLLVLTGNHMLILWQI